MVTDSMEDRILDILVEAAADGRISRQSVEGGYQRITAMKVKYGLMRLPKVEKALTVSNPPMVSQNPAPAPSAPN
jgi:hypothetical protein